MYTIKEIRERQKILSEHYKFECICVPCANNWPLLSTLKEEAKSDPNDERFSRFPCLKCTQCGQTLKRDES